MLETIQEQTGKTMVVHQYHDGSQKTSDVSGKANAGLTLGIIGTALAGLLLVGGRRGGFNLFGGGTSDEDFKTKWQAEMYANGVLPNTSEKVKDAIEINNAYMAAVQATKDEKIINAFEKVQCHNERIFERLELLKQNRAFKNPVYNCLDDEDQTSTSTKNK